jgi:sugar phosphate isomerase/epimerase
VNISCTDFTFPLLDHEGALDVVRLLDLKAVDLVLMDHSHLRPADLHADPTAWSRTLEQRLDERGLAVADILLIQSTTYGEFAWNHPDPKQRERAADIFGSVLQIAQAIDASGITLLPGIEWPDESVDASIQRSAEELKRRVDEGAAAGIRVSAEPHLGSFAETPERTLELVDRCPGLTLTVDYGHYVYQGIPESEIEPLVAHARHFHARGGRRGRLQTSMRENAIDFDRMVDVMRANGYDGFIGLEYVWFHGDGPYAQCAESDTISESILLRDALREALGA